MTLQRTGFAGLLALAVFSGLGGIDFGQSADAADDQGSLARAAEKSGFSAERLKRLSAALDRKVVEKAWPGSVSIIARDGQILHLEAHGSLDQDVSTPMPTDAIFRIMSMTKPIVSVTAMALWEQGLFNLDDPIDRLLPELKGVKVVDGKSDGTAPLVRPITIYDLLRHTSGFTYAFAAQDPSRPAYVRAIAADYAKGGIQTDVTPEGYLSRLAAIPLIQQPGTAFEYSVSTDVLGILLERLTGKRLNRLVKDIVLDPLRMEDSGFDVPASKLGRLANAYDTDKMKAGLWAAVPSTRDETVYSKASNGMFSTAGDYFRFAQMMMNGGELEGVQIIAPKTVELMTSDHISDLGGSTAFVAGPGYGFGLGFAVRREAGLAVVPGSPGDFNWPGIAGTSFTVDRKERIVAVMMVQAPSNRIKARHLFKDLLYSAIIRQ